MLRMPIIAVLALLSTSASAQVRDAGKGIKFGVGCIGAVSTFAPRLGACVIEGSMSRIWCPNGQVFDRNGALPQSSIVRSVCNLNQTL